MSAVVCGKRSSSIFDELLHTNTPPASKRVRCASSPTSSLRISPSRASPSFDHNDGDLIAAYLARTMKANGVDSAAAATGLPNVDALPTDGSEWVELFVREMMSAADIDDARTRASRALEFLEKSIIARAGAEVMENLHKVP
ncbi:hypothetical protein GW17_00041428 [Ensete ventricosum]|nr:hypothetical protein GW17_00041428 [Ensete ventricosum]